MRHTARLVGDFATRFAWLLFLAIGVLYIWFGWTDIDEATTYHDSVAAMSLLVIGVLTFAIAATALRRRERWAWIAMLIWPVFGISFAVFGQSVPGAPAFGIAHVIVPGTALLIAAPSYLRGKSSPQHARASAKGTVR